MCLLTDCRSCFQKTVLDRKYTQSWQSKPLRRKLSSPLLPFSSKMIRKSTHLDWWATQRNINTRNPVYKGEYSSSSDGILGLPVLVTEARDLLRLLQNELLQAAGEERVLQQLDLHATRLVQYLSRRERWGLKHGQDSQDKLHVWTTVKVLCQGNNTLLCNLAWSH